MYPHHCRPSLILNGPWHCPLWFRTVPQKKILSPNVARPKIQNGLQALGMVRPTFFLWEINQKFFFLSLSFHILVTRNNNFCHPGGPNGSLVGVHRISGYPVRIRFFGLSGDRISGSRIMDYPETGYRISGKNAWDYIILTLWDVFKIKLGIFWKKEIENRTSHSRDIEF